MNKYVILTLIILSTLILFFAAFKFLPSTQKNDLNNSSTNQPQTQTTQQASTELKVEDIKIGTGDGAKAGDNLRLYYTGKLTNGTVFDSNVGSEQFTFKLGGGEVIKGWDQGLVGMKIGGRRTLTIPPELAYGTSGSGSIPPNAILIFDVELVGIN